MDLHVTDIYIDDLKDDIRTNYDYSLYEFLDGDIVKAFYFGYVIKKEFENLDQDRQYLYSKQLRHISLDIQEYLEQIKFWINKFAKEDEEIDVIELSEYILNNIIYFDSKDLIIIALHLGLNCNEDV